MAEHPAEQDQAVLFASGERQIPSPARQATARQRAAQKRVRRVEAARQELEKIQSEDKEASPARVSLTDAEARVMKHAGGAYAPRYNVQISTDAAQKVIVGVAVGQNASDAVLLHPALQTFQRRLGQRPRQLVADGGYATQANIADLAARPIEFYAPLPKADKNPDALRRRGVTPAFFPEQFAYDAGGDQFLCPAGKVRHHSTTGARSQRPARVSRPGGGRPRACGPGAVHAPVSQPLCPANRGAPGDHGVSAEDGNRSGKSRSTAGVRKWPRSPTPGSRPKSSGGSSAYAGWPKSANRRYGPP